MTARDERVAALTRDGYTASQIAAHLNISKRTVLRARGRTGTMRPRVPPLAPDELRLADTLLADGASYGEVARTLGRGRDAIRRRLPGRSIWTAGSGTEIARYNAALDSIGVA